jgi:acyl-CoA thioesterase-2
VPEAIPAPLDPVLTRQEALEQALTILDVQPDPAAGEDHFTGTSHRPRHRIFGGQVLGQSLIAASRTVPADRVVHSLHAYFLRPGDPEVPIEFAVERLSDGRSFSARRTHALQKGRPILSMIASFQHGAPGLEHQTPMPALSRPEELSVPDLAHSRPIETRHVEGPIYDTPGPEKVAQQAVWIRASAKMPDDPLLHTALLAYASDYSILEPALRAHGLTWAEPDFSTASLDHAMWFHRPARADEWLLYVQESPSASGARGLGLGRIYTADGVLVASVAQEGMMRLRRVV